MVKNELGVYTARRVPQLLSSEYTESLLPHGGTSSADLLSRGYSGTVLKPENKRKSSLDFLQVDQVTSKLAVLFVRTLDSAGPRAWRGMMAARCRFRWVDRVPGCRVAPFFPPRALAGHAAKRHHDGHAARSAAVDPTDARICRRTSMATRCDLNLVDSIAGCRDAPRFRKCRYHLTEE